MAGEATAREAGNVLVVAEDARLRWPIAAVLVREGFSVQEAGTALAALRKLDSDGAPRLLIVDLELSMLSGRDLIDIAHRRWFDLPVVAICAEGRLREAAAEVDEGGPVWLIERPVTPGRLLAAVDQALAGRQ